jgi:hypothetical protein
MGQLYWQNAIRRSYLNIKTHSITQITSVSNWLQLHHPEDGGNTFLRNVGVKTQATIISSITAVKACKPTLNCIHFINRSLHSCLRMFITKFSRLLEYNVLQLRRRKCFQPIDLLWNDKNRHRVIDLASMLQNKMLKYSCMTPLPTQYTRKLKMYVLILPPSLSPIAIQCTATLSELVTDVSAPNTTTTTNSRQTCYYVPYENCLAAVLNSMNTYKSHR